MRERKDSALNPSSSSLSRDDDYDDDDSEEMATDGVEKGGVAPSPRGGNGERRADRSATDGVMMTLLSPCGNRGGE